MPQYVRQGNIPHKRHTIFRNDEGGLRYEELFSTRGFDGPYSLLYHEKLPVELSAIDAAGEVERKEWICPVRRNHSFATSKLDNEGDFLSSRRTLAFNEDVSVAVATPDRAMDNFYRNGLCDELIIVVEGRGILHSAFGDLPFGPEDMLVVPRGTTTRFEPAGKTRLLIMESRTEISPPGRYFVSGGQMAEHSPFCERDIRVPVLAPANTSEGQFTIVTKFGDNLTAYTHPYHPFDVVGWDGSLYPYAINLEDYEPLTRRIHTMPDEHQAFGTTGAAVLCFVPRLSDYHKDSMPAPPVHSNIDCDEILFNLGGPLLGRGSGGIGEMTFHPRGLLHGPKVFEETIGMKEFPGKAIAIDTFKPLRLTTYAEACDDADYHRQWRARPRSPAEA